MAWRVSHYSYQYTGADRPVLTRPEAPSGDFLESPGSVQWGRNLASISKKRGFYGRNIGLVDRRWHAVDGHHCRGLLDHPLRRHFWRPVLLLAKARPADAVTKPRQPDLALDHRHGGQVAG